MRWLFLHLRVRETPNTFNTWTLIRSTGDDCQYDENIWEIKLWNKGKIHITNQDLWNYIDSVKQERTSYMEHKYQHLYKLANITVDSDSVTSYKKQNGI